jgi:hypothetical protein
MCLKSTAHKLGLFDVAISPCSISPKLTRIKVDSKMFVKVFSSDWPTLRPTFLHLMLIRVFTYLFFYILMSISLLYFFRTFSSRAIKWF